MLALLRYRAVNRAIARGDVRGGEHLIIAVAIVVALLGTLMIAYMLLAAQRL